MTLPKGGAVFRKQRPERPPSSVKHRYDDVGSVLANHRGGGESSVVVTTLYAIIQHCLLDGSVTLM